MTVIFPLELYLKIRAYINSLDSEISGMGKIRVEGETIYVEDIRIFPQVVSGAHTTIDGRGLAKFFDGLIQEGQNTGAWKLWWHSHPDFEAYFSPVDDATIAEFDNETPDGNWIIGLVMNQKGEYQIRVQVFQPFPFIENAVELRIQYPEYSNLEEIVNDIEENVTVQKFDIKKSNWPWPSAKNKGEQDVLDDEEYLHAGSTVDTLSSVPIGGQAYDTEEEYATSPHQDYGRKHKKRRKH